ncbi:MAG: RNase adapter RapZ [Acetobacteraceae bacterium]
MKPERLRVVLVTGLSGGGKASVLRELEDLGYEAVDNPPLTMLEEMVGRSDQRLAIGVDARTRGFDAALVLETLDRLHDNPALRPELVFAWADETTLLRRYTETRRRHPMAPQGRVSDGIAQEETLTAPLRERADLVIDTTGLPLASLRRLIDRHFGVESDADESRLVVSLISFAFRHGLPREADLVFDARFLRNPHYDPILQPRTGLDADVGAFIEADPDFATFFAKMADLIDMLLPRFVQEGKKYATITIGCTGGRHRSVYVVEKLAHHLADRIAADQASGLTGQSWRLHVTHRELAREGLEAAYLTDRSVPRPADAGDLRDAAAMAAPVQAQEA